MPISRRYHPEMQPGEISVFAFDFSPLIPVGVGIVSATLDILSPVYPYPYAEGGITAADGSGVQGIAASWLDRTAYATLHAVDEGLGIDHLLRWTATDTLGNTWVRSTLVLCAYTS